MTNSAVTPTPEVRKKQWTLMFFLASDNTLSPSTLPQLKAIKAAGSQADTNVLAYFDPNELGAPTRVFQINRNAGSVSDSGSGEPVVTVLASDYVSPEEIRGRRGTISQEFATSLLNRDALTAEKALEQFLGFCRESYPAHHYMLFVLGHGLVVGRDAFLPDDNPDSAIGLITLGRILREFSGAIGNDKLELIGMHSCSMSAVEVAYELKGTANYMLASQGLSFVGSWPYRQFLMKIYHDVGQPSGANVPQLVKSLHNLCIRYSVDFMHAGYSSDLCLCSLDSNYIDALTPPISRLSQALQSGVTEPRCRDLIVLAHWKSQSYWQETYSDLYDFCFCLSRLCNEPGNSPSGDTRREYDINRVALIEACAAVMSKLKPENGRRVGPVVCADYVGPDVQYSHGLSIYFPWSRPLQDENDHVIDNYQQYAFSSNFGAGAHTWFRFLNVYFNRTQRPDRLAEEDRANNQNSEFREAGYRMLLETARNTFSEEVAVGSRDFVPSSVLEGKVTPPDASGGGCSCASTKNYSRLFSLSPGAAKVFDTGRPQTASAGGAPSSG